MTHPGTKEPSPREGSERSDGYGSQGQQDVRHGHVTDEHVGVCPHLGVSQDADQQHCVAPYSTYTHHAVYGDISITRRSGRYAPILLAPIKSTIHDSNVDEIVDSGSGKKTDAKLDLKTAEKLEKDDTEYVGVTDEVADSTKDVNETEVNSPYLALVNVRPSFEYTVEKK